MYIFYDKEVDAYKVSRKMPKNAIINDKVQLVGVLGTTNGDQEVVNSILKPLPGGWVPSSDKVEKFLEQANSKLPIYIIRYRDRCLIKWYLSPGFKSLLLSTSFIDDPSEIEIIKYEINPGSLGKTLTTLQQYNIRNDLYKYSEEIDNIFNNNTP